MTVIHQLKEKGIWTILFLSYLIASITLLDRIPGLEDIQLNWWIDAREFIFAVSIWMSLFFYSAVILYIATLLHKKSIPAIISAGAITLYWLHILFRASVATLDPQGSIFPESKIIVYTVLVIGGVVTIIGLLTAMKKISTRKNTHDLITEKRRLIRKLNKLNPESSDIFKGLSSNVDTIHLMEIASLEDDPIKQKEYYRRALHEAAKTQEHIHRLKKKIGRLTTI